MTDYIQTSEFKADYPNSEFGLSSPDYDYAIGSLITSASRLIDKEIGKGENYFFPSSDTTDRYYDGTGNTELYIDDAVSISAVAVSESGSQTSSDFTAWSSSDYITYPYNETPKRKLIVDLINGSKVYFDQYRRNVKITGIFGYSTTPPQLVKEAVKIQVARWLMRQKQLWQDNNQSEFGGVVLNFGNKNFIGTRLDPDVAMMLEPYKLDAMGEE